MPKKFARTAIISLFCFFMPPPCTLLLSSSRIPVSQLPSHDATRKDSTVLLRKLPNCLALCLCRGIFVWYSCQRGRTLVGGDRPWKRALWSVTKGHSLAPDFANLRVVPAARPLRADFTHPLRGVGQKIFPSPAYIGARNFARRKEIGYALSSRSSS